MMGYVSCVSCHLVILPNSTHFIISIQVYTIDEIIGYNCTKWTESLLGDQSDNPQIIAGALVCFMVVFLLLVTLMTGKLGTFSVNSKLSQARSDHEQSLVLQSMYH